MAVCLIVHTLAVAALESEGHMTLASVAAAADQYPTMIAGKELADAPGEDCLLVVD